MADALGARYAAQKRAEGALRKSESLFRLIWDRAADGFRLADAAGVVRMVNPAYSRLIGLDDAGTLRRLRTLRRALIDPAIREHGGRVVQTAVLATGRVRQHRRGGALRGEGAAAGAGL